MSAEISIVIPTLNAAKELPACAAALIEGVTGGLVRDLVVSDGGSSDDTLNIADALGATMITGGPSRGGQLRRGVAATNAAWVLILHADTQLAPGWMAVVRAHIEDGGGAPGAFRLAFRTSGMWSHAVAGWANLRSRVFGLPYGDQGLLVRRSMYDKVGGYPDLPLMEDVALVRALPERPVLLDCIAATSAERYIKQGWLRRGAANLWTLAKYFLGVDPNRLAQQYRR